MNREELLKNAKPIIFSTSMVKAILDGKKTQTRRVIKIEDAPENWKISIAGTSIVRAEPYDVKLPRYAAGDILWVRETWSEHQEYYNNSAKVFAEPHYIYKADGVYANKWRPSIHMPKEAARILLKVTGVRVERLQDITEEQAIKEGVKDPYDYMEPWFYERPSMQGLEYHRAAFAGLWFSTIPKYYEDYMTWEGNPWVWVIEFERVEVKNETK
jgi:hypothetical protein